MGGGALITGKFNTQFEKAMVFLGGPVGGGMSALVCGAIYYFTKAPIWSAITVLVTMINLFNLVPVSMLDGGQLFRTLMYSINRTAGMIFLVVSSKLV